MSIRHRPLLPLEEFNERLRGDYRRRKRQDLKDALACLGLGLAFWVTVAGVVTNI